MVRVRTPRLLLLGAVLAVAVTSTIPALAADDTSTADVPVRRAVSAAVIRTTTADAPVQVNVDIGMRVRAGRRCTSSLPGVCTTGGTVYHPCFNLRDRFYGGCEVHTLFRVLQPDTPWELAQGITIGSASTARDGRIVEHGWADRLTQADLEVYAADPDRRFGDVRLRVPDFSTVFRDTAYSAQIGHLRLPRQGQADVGRLTGRAVGAGGRSMPPGSFKLDLFGHGNTMHRSGLLGGQSFQEFGFGGAMVRDGVTDGSFSSKPLWAGAYDVHVQRKGASFSCGLDVRPDAPTAILLDFARPNLGNPRCVPMRSLAQGLPG